MKKLLSIALMLMLCIGFTACSGDNLENLSSAEIVEKAKADGANWSVDQWKSATKGMLKNMKPLMEKMISMKEEAEKDPAKALEMLSKMQEELKGMQEIEEQYKEFEKLARDCDNGKAVLDDEEWGKSVLKDLGIPEDALK